METATDRGQELLNELASLDAVRAKAEAAMAERMLELSDLRRREAERHESTVVRELEASFSVDEIALAIKVPTGAVQTRVTQYRRIRGRLPLVWEAFGAGRIDGYRASLIAAAAEKLPDDNVVFIELDHWASRYAATHTVSQTRAWLRRFVARHANDRKAHRAEKEKRGVWVDHQDDGMSLISAYVPTTDAHRLDAELTLLAKAEPSDGRTLEQKRADVFCTLGTGYGAGGRAVIGVVVPVTSLAGLDDEPGISFDGEFALPAELVRDLAAEPGTFFHRVFTDPLGRILDITEVGRFPSAKLKIAIDIRDGTCRFATCSRPATECDDDHEIPHPRGPTTGRNLRSLCRRHHRIKTHLGIEPTELHVHHHGSVEGASFDRLKSIA